MTLDLRQQSSEQIRGDKRSGNLVQQDKRFRAAPQELGQGFLAGRTAGDHVNGFRHKPPRSWQILGSHPDDDFGGKG